MAIKDVAQAKRELAKLLAYESESGLTGIELAQREQTIQEQVPVSQQSDKQKVLQDFYQEWVACKRCPLHEKRNSIVFGEGDVHAKIMFIGEGPGAEEDKQGRPFVGRAGQLLTRMIKAMGFDRQQVFITNIVKCRPPGNRDPEYDEVDACNPLLVKQVATIQPQIIVTLGRPAAHCLFRVTTPISRMRGRWREFQGVPVMPTFHPAYLLRNPKEKGVVWEDLQAVVERLGLKIPEWANKKK